MILMIINIIITGGYANYYIHDSIYSNTLYFIS
jgi:hypothetical protein